jgi:hypothetical protein
MKITKHTPENIESFSSDLKSVLTELEESTYLFIIADSEKANLFLFNTGELEKSQQYSDDGVQRKTKINSRELYGRNTKLTHKINNQLKEHVQRIMHDAEAFILGRHINGVFIGGHKPLFHLMIEELPANLEKKLRGEFVTELNILEHDLIKHCKQVLAEYIQ